MFRIHSKLRLPLEWLTVRSAADYVWPYLADFHRPYQDTDRLAPFGETTVYGSLAKPLTQSWRVELNQVYQIDTLGCSLLLQVTEIIDRSTQWRDRAPGAFNRITVIFVHLLQLLLHWSILADMSIRIRKVILTFSVGSACGRACNTGRARVVVAPPCTDFFEPCMRWVGL